MNEIRLKVPRRLRSWQEYYLTMGLNVVQSSTLRNQHTGNRVSIQS
jgi:hypothetical protein